MEIDAIKMLKGIMVPSKSKLRAEMPMALKSISHAIMRAEQIPGCSGIKLTIFAVPFPNINPQPQ